MTRLVSQTRTGAACEVASSSRTERIRQPAPTLTCRPTRFRVRRGFMASIELSPNPTAKRGLSRLRASVDRAEEKLAVCGRRPPVHQRKGRAAVASDSGGQGDGRGELGLLWQSGSGEFEKPIGDRAVFGWPETVSPCGRCRSAMHRAAVSGRVIVRFIRVKSRPSRPEVFCRAFKTAANDSNSHLRVATLAPDGTEAQCRSTARPRVQGRSSRAATHNAARAGRSPGLRCRAVLPHSREGFSASADYTGKLAKGLQGI